MKNLFRFLTACLIVSSLASCKLGRFVYYNFADITDHKIFPYRTATNDSVKFTFEQSGKPKFPKKITMGNSKETGFDNYLADNKTVAFLIIKDDSIHYEKYFRGYDETSVVASFSMAKSVTSMLIGCAIEDGYIKSVDEPITNYIPEFKNKEELSRVTIKHALQMTSGIKFNESYINPFGDAATYYYGTNLRKAIYKRKLAQEPGIAFSYSSGDTQILGLVLERALKGKKITQYLEEKIWKPLGMEYDATWSLDREKDGLEKTFCCINARARDFAKLGRLYLNKGNWNGTQVMPQKWVEASTTPDSLNGGVRYYKYQWWLGQNGNYAAQGILGQFIFVCPSKNLIIVRLGEDEGNGNWEYLFNMLAENY